MIDRFSRWIRWWRWYLQEPNIGSLVVRGIDKASRDIIYARHDEKEPPRP